MSALVNHRWKGNIRELKNTIERMLILADDNEFIDVSLLPVEFRHSNVSDTSFDLETIERLHILKVLNYTQGNKTEAARLLNIGLTTLYRKLEHFKLG